MDLMVCIQRRASDELLAAVTRHGAGLELQSYGMIGSRSEQDWEGSLAAHRELRERFTGRVALHGPYVGLIFCQLDHLLRDAVRARMDRLLETARQLRPATLVMHAGWNAEVAQFGLQDRWLEGTIAFWRAELPRYEELGVQVVIENVSEISPATLCTICDEVSHPQLGICLDVGHANFCSELSLAEWVEQLGPRLRHLHLHDNHGEADEHLPMGQGTIDFAPLWPALEAHAPEATLSIEADAEPAAKIANLDQLVATLAGR